MPEAEIPLGAPDIPDKLYFRIGEVSKLLAVETYVLRYWETEFPSLSPKKSETGQRLYRRKDVEKLLRIKELLYDKRFTIEGARQALAIEPKPVKKVEVPRGQVSLFAPTNAVPEIRRELAEILKLLH